MKSEFVTKFLDRNWAKWYENVEPIILTQEEENRRQTVRRKTVKMCEEDPDEDQEKDYGGHQ